MAHTCAITAHTPKGCVDEPEGRLKLRSLMFVPGDRPDRMEKALRAGADALILDLEDSVAPNRKSEARAHVAGFLRRKLQGAAVLVRINPLHLAFADEDLAAVAEAAPDGYVLPKAEGAASVVELQLRLKNRGMPPSHVLPIAETPAAIFRLPEYSSVADRMLGLTWGAEDIAAAVGAAAARGADGRFTTPYETIRTLALLGAHVAGVPAIETVYPAFRDLDGLSESAARAAHDGFTGMLAIHPSQVPVINSAFTPTADAIARARRIVAAFEDNANAGVLNVDGAMVDAPHLKQAQRLLARAEAISRFHSMPNL
jgi:citrate lyase subunit beta/citryl-CoA lyase